MNVFARLAAMTAFCGLLPLAGAVLPGSPTCRSALAAPRPKELKARRAFAAGQYQEALDLFADLYAETLHPVYLRNIGRCHQKMREADKAIDAFRSYLEKSPKIAADDRAEVEGYIREMQELQANARPATPVVPAAAEPAPAPPPPSVPEPGPPSVLASTEPSPTADDRPFYRTWWFWTATGALVAGAAVTAVVLSSGGGTRTPCAKDLLGCQ